MKKQLQFRNILVEKISKITFVFFFLSSFSFFGQQASLTVTKTIVENTTTCNTFDVSIDVEGVASTRPQEVVLVIDRSGSMGDDTAVPTPIEYAQDAAIEFVNNLFLPANNPTGLNKVSIVTYSVSATIDRHLTDVSGKQQIINTINSIATGGTTNIEDAMVKARNELNSHGTFDCATSRSIILLTDGVANEDNLGHSCSEVIYNTTCQTRAVTAGQNAWIINKSGTDYNQSVFTIGLTGSISGTRQIIALSTLNQIQNAGAYSTENNADLNFIYNQIFGQLNYAAKQLPGQAFLTTTIVPGFEVVSGTIQTNKGTVSLNAAGDVLSWFVPQVATETLYLRYSIVANNATACGNQNPEDTEINYENSTCQPVSQMIPSPDICVPCPTLTADISRQGCTKFIDYTGTFGNGPCGNFSAEFGWKFYLNNVQVGTSNTLSGTYEYTGSELFEGTFSAVLTFIGSGTNGCTIPGITADDSINLLSPPDAPTSTGDIEECEQNPIQTLNANDAIVPVPDQTIVWYDAPTGGNVVNNPILNTVGTITYYAEAMVDGQCGSSERTPVKLTINPAPSAPISTGDIEECAQNPIQTLNANDAITPVSGQTVVWYDALTGGNVVNDPILNAIGTITYYAQSTNTTTQCSSFTRTAVTLSIFALPNAPISGGDQTECAADPIQTLTATATVPNGQIITWYDAATGGNVVNPILNTIGTVTYYAEASNTVTTCVSSTRTAVTLTLNNCAISIVKTASPNNPQGCTPLAPGETISYTFTVTNEGNAPIINVVVNDAFIDPINPIPGPTSGDVNSNNILDVGEIWIYNATYTVLQQDIINGQVVNTALVNGTVTGTSTSYDVTDSDTVTVTLCQNAEISIVKASESATGDCIPFNVDDTIDYTFTVTNEGDIAISNVVVTDTKLGGAIAGPASGDNNNNNILDVGEVWIYEADYTVSQADIDAGSIINTAEVNGISALGTVDATSNTVTVLICTTPSIALIKVGAYDGTDPTGACVSTPGDVINYTFSVKNTGNVTLNNIIVTDPLVTVIGGPIATLAPGAENTTTFTATYIITQEDIDAGMVTNQALATGTPVNGPDVMDDSDNDSYTQDDPTITTICQNPLIAIVKTASYDDGGDCSDPGETINYTFTITNQGNVSLSAITVNDPLLGGVVAGPDSGDTDNDGNLDVTETWIYTGSYNITQTDIDNGEVVNQATATGISPNQTTVSDLSGSTITTNDPTITSLCQNASISVIKNQTSPAGGLGDLITYDIVVTNTGNTTISNIGITDANAVITGGNPIASLAPGDSATVTAQHEITQGDLDQGYVENTATATGDSTNGTDDVIDVSDTGTDTGGNPIPDPESVETPDGQGNTNGDPTDDPTVTILEQGPAIAIVKTSSYDDGGDCSDPSEIINYTFTVTNQGNVSLSNIIVNDPLLGGVVAGPDSGDTDNDNELDVSETWIYTGAYTITQEDIDAGEVKNQATATGTAPDQSTVSDLSGSTTTTDDTTITTLCQNAVIAIIKTGVFNDENQDGCSNVDETISYTFTVTNEGNIGLLSIEVSDPLIATITGPTGDTDNDGILDITEIWIYTGTYAITQEDIDNGEVVNQATAKGATPSGNIVTDLSDESSTTGNDPTVVGLCQNPVIAIVKTGLFNDENQDGCTNVDETISYTFTVTNEGNVSLSNITVTDPLIATITGPTGDTDGDGVLDVTETWIYLGTYAVTQVDIDAGQVTNQATATGTAPDTTVVSDLSDESSVLGNDPTVVSLCQNPVIALIKTGTVNDTNGNGCADIGETISYNFEVFNLGNVTLSNITIADPLVTVSGGPITLAPGTTDATSFTATYIIVQADIDAGFVQNQATVTGTAPLGNTVTDLSDDDSELENDPTIIQLCQNPTIALIKVGVPADENGDGCAGLGETILYSFSIKNMGNVALTNVIITDPLVNITGAPITLAAGATDTNSFSGVYTITQADVEAGFVQNQATVQGTDPNGNIVTDLSDDDSYVENDPTITLICQNPSISLEKTGEFRDENGDGASDVGETIAYSFKVTNTGNVTLYNITISDPLPGIQILGGPIAVLLPGESDSTTFTAIYAITQEDIDNLEVVNQATVLGEDSNGNTVTDDSDDPTDLTNIDNDGDGDPDDPTVVVLPDVLDISSFEIYNGITPNGDGFNDYFWIKGIHDYPNNNVKIYNRWGILVFETDSYGQGDDDSQNTFRGVSEGRVTVQKNEELPTGTYYYILTFPADNPGKSSYNGYLYINR